MNTARIKRNRKFSLSGRLTSGRSKKVVTLFTETLASAMFLDKYANNYMQNKTKTYVTSIGSMLRGNRNKLKRARDTKA